MRDEIVAVTVVGQDRPGIVADVTGALADLHGNLEDSTMTLLRGHFAMVLLVHTGAGTAAIEAALRPLSVGGSLVINARELGEPALSIGSPRTRALMTSDPPAVNGRRAASIAAVPAPVCTSRTMTK